MTATTGYAWAPGTKYLSHSHGVGEFLARTVVRAATYRILWGLPLGVVVLVGLVGLAVLLRSRGGVRR